jgi:hypothetical protein
MPVVEEAERVGDEFERQRADPLDFPIDIETAACPMFRGEGGKPFLQETAIESRIVGHDEHGPPEQIVHGTIIHALTGDYLIGDPGQAGDFRRNQKAGIFEPFPGTKDLVDPHVVPSIFEEADGGVGVAPKTRRRAPSNEADRQEKRLKDAKLVPIVRAGSRKSVPSPTPDPKMLCPSPRRERVAYLSF